VLAVAAGLIFQRRPSSAPGAGRAAHEDALVSERQAGRDECLEQAA
jgi:hypothetical protein